MSNWCGELWVMGYAFLTIALHSLSIGMFTACTCTSRHPRHDNSNNVLSYWISTQPFLSVCFHDWLLPRALTWCSSEPTPQIFVVSLLAVLCTLSKCKTSYHSLLIYNWRRLLRGPPNWGQRLRLDKLENLWLGLSSTWPTLMQ